MSWGAVYKVGARRGYRGHAPGTVFEAVLDPAAERRAIERGDIRIVQRITPSLRPGSYLLPDGWLKPQEV